MGYLLNSIAHFPASFAVVPFNPQASTIDGAPLGFLFANSRVYSRNDLAKMVDNAGFTSIQFHNLTQLPGNSLMIGVRA